MIYTKSNPIISLKSIFSSRIFAFMVIPLSMFYFSCQKEPIPENSLTVSEDNEVVCRSCSTLANNTTDFPTPTVNATAGSPYNRTTGKLYKARLYVAYYRLYINLRSSWVSISNQVDQNELSTKSRLPNTNLPNLTLINAAFSSANSGTTDFLKVTKFADYLWTSFQPSDNDIVYNASKNYWDVPYDAADTTGSYTIIFASGKTYAGKGKITRAQSSSNSVCANNAMDNPTKADHEFAYSKFYRPAGVSNDRQAFKEEAVRIYARNGLTVPSSSVSYNAINSPGIGYINTDHY
jgi:hypothetical protein